MWWSLNELRPRNNFDDDADKVNAAKGEVTLYEYIQLVTFNQRQPHQFIKSLVNIGLGKLTN